MAKKKQIELTIEEKLQNALVPKEEQPYKIPSNWCWVRLGNITQIKGGKRIPKGTSLLKENTGYKYIRVTDMKNGTVLNDDIHYISKDIYNKISNYTISKNDIYITCAGTIGRVGIIPVEFDGANLTENADKIIIKHINKYLLVKVLSSYIVQKQIQEVITTGCQPKLAIKKIEQLKIPLPPINEQQRIVNVIESLFAKLDEAKQLIQNTIDKFEQNKMAILHKAFSGELTAKWREENNIDLSSWQKKSIAKLCKSLKYGTAKKSSKTGSVAVLRMGNLQHGEIDWSDLVYTDDEEDIKKYLLSAGDVLFNRTNSPELVGKTSIYRGEYPAIYAGYLIKLDYGKELIGEYLNYVMNSIEAKKYCYAIKTDGVSQSNINAKKIGAFIIPVPTIEEQQAIVNIIDRIFIKYDKIKDLQAQIDKIELLKKSILAKAFRGELGTNDPNEESAEVLLRKILAEK